jgi:hypothetical protein
MRKPPSEPDLRGVRLEQLVRKALADAWARGVTSEEAESMAVQIARSVFPDIRDSEIASVMNSLRH